jgi:hypothetical protein
LTVAQKYPDRFSYIRAVHEVRWTTELEKYLRRIVRIGTDEFGYKGNTLIPKTTAHDEIVQGADTPHEVIGIEAMHTYPPNGLRITTFERRRARNPRDNNALRRMADRLGQLDIAPLYAEYGVGGDELVVKADGIEAANFHDELPGLEFSLRLQESSTTSLIVAEHNLLYEEAQRPAGSTRPSRELMDIPNNPAQIPILRTPESATPAQIVSFSERVNDIMVSRPPLEIELDELEWDIKLR